MRKPRRLQAGDTIGGIQRHHEPARASEPGRAHHLLWAGRGGRRRQGDDELQPRLAEAGADAGIVIRECQNYKPHDYEPGFPSTLSLEDILDELIVPLGVPAVYELPVGHGKHHFTLPLSGRARLDASALDLSVVEVATEPAARC